MLTPREGLQLEHLHERITRGAGILLGCAVMAIVFAIAAWLQVGPWVLWALIAAADATIGAYVAFVLVDLIHRRDALQVLDRQRNCTPVHQDEFV